MIKRILNQPPKATIVEFYHNKVLRYFFAAGFATAATLSILQTPRYATGEEIEAARASIAEQFI